MTSLWTRWVLIVLGLATVAAPGASRQLFGGVPLSVAGLLVFGGVLYVGLALPALSWCNARWIAIGLVAVLGLKVAAVVTEPAVGLKASYFASSRPGDTPERSIDFAHLDAGTRIEAALDLRGEDFAVHFFNDAARFNFGPDLAPGRDQLPFSVRWQGWLLAPSDGERRILVEANGPAQVWLDDAELPLESNASIAAGLHTLQVEYTRPEARVPSLKVSWQRQPGGALETLREPDIRWRANGAASTISHWLGIMADVSLASVVLAWLALALGRLTSDARNGRSRAILAVLPLAFLVYGMLLEAPAAGRATILSGLDDWLVYESSARDILLNGLLMSGGQPHAPAFYGQPLYPYALALMHWLTGESLFGPLALQFAGLGAAVVGTALLAHRAFGTALDGLVAIVAVLVLLQLEPEHFKIARQLFNENLYMPLVMASLILLVGLARRPTPPRAWQALLSGLVLGLTAISRSQFLLCVPFVLPVLVFAWRRERMRAAASVLLVALGVMFAIAPVTARNVVVSGQFVPITSGGGASLLEFHRPPPGLIDQSAVQSDPLFEALHLDQQTRTVLAFARADPRGYVATLAPLAAHSVGLQGRNDPGIYWPLFAAFVVYLASFGLKCTRRLHVWPIHAFVASHLLVLMLFEADTYGYRLVMPMYAPLVAVAAQVPLAAVRGLVRSRPGTAMRGGDAVRTERFAATGWSAIAALALLWQARGVVELWPERETFVHGLGGAAAHAARTSDGVGASAIYVASIDGTPRRFGAGSLPGLRYPWFKWFDPTRSLPLPATSARAVYMLSELAGHASTGDLTTCLGQPDGQSEIVVDGARARQLCVATLLDGSSSATTFDGLARVEVVRAPGTASAGDTIEARLVWQPLLARAEPHETSLQLDDPASDTGTLLGNGTLDLYPARQWQPDEMLLSRIPIATDATAIPQAYRLTLGMRPTSPNAPPAMASWQGSRTDRVPVSTITLSPGTAESDQALPADMQRLTGPPLIGGGLELIGARPLPAEAAIGAPLQVGLLWRADQDQPPAAQFTLRLVRDSGEVVQESALPLLGGRVAPSALSVGNVVRDEEKLVISARVPSEALALELTTPGASVRLGSIKMTGRAHAFDAASLDPEATFGDGMQLLSHQVEPPSARPGAQFKVKLRWRSGAELRQAYKVFVHVLDPAGQEVVAQRDAEPQDGRAPTTSWVLGEVIDDEYAITLPADLARGAYPIEIGVYEPRSGDRLRLGNGDNRLLLSTHVEVTQ